MYCSSVLFFFFKQKTAYEMRISDWSSDVCSSDLPVLRELRKRVRLKRGDRNVPGSISFARNSKPAAGKEIERYGYPIGRSAQCAPVGSAAFFRRVPRAVVHHVPAVAGHRPDARSGRAATRYFPSHSRWEKVGRE